MSEYVNTFALISFRFDNPEDSLKYEYYLEKESSGDHIVTSAAPRLLSSRRVQIEEEPEEVEEPLVTYWVVNNVNENKFDIVSLTGFVSEDEIQSKFAGPFYSSFSAKLFIDKIIK